MELCLYDPELGYYCADVERFGKAGDFYTSSDIHAIFARLMARQFEEMWRAMDSPAEIEFVEFGPGRGLFARDLLDWSEAKFPDFFQALQAKLIERSAALRERIGRGLARHVDSGKVSIHDQAQAMNRPAIVFANEFLDALPFEVLSRRGELRIAEDRGAFLETWCIPSEEESAFLERHSVRPEREERIEAQLAGQRFMSQSAARLRSGFFIVVDYGYTQAEQFAGRHRGTLMTYRRHSASADPYEAPGEQDITAHVNFTALGSAAREQGVQVEPLLTQSQFLMGIGEKNKFADVFEGCRGPQEKAKVTLQLKHLITPTGLGETFQVLVATKGVSDEKVQSLNGLRYAPRIG